MAYRYGDRLVSEVDLRKFRTMLKEIGKKQFKDMDLSIIFPTPLVFCHFANGLTDNAYDQVHNSIGHHYIGHEYIYSYGYYYVGRNCIGHST